VLLEGTWGIQLLLYYWPAASLACWASGFQLLVFGSTTATNPRLDGPTASSKIRRSEDSNDSLLVVRTALGCPWPDHGCFFASSILRTFDVTPSARLILAGEVR
jgi:hypothetical protein